MTFPPFSLTFFNHFKAFVTIFEIRSALKNNKKLNYIIISMCCFLKHNWHVNCLVNSTERSPKRERKAKKMENVKKAEDLLFQEDDNDNKKGMSNVFPHRGIPKSSSPAEKEPATDTNYTSLFPLLLELIDRTRGSLAAMKTLAFYSRENFKDRELGDYFYRVVSEDIEKTISLLDCFCDYINVNTPVKKSDTIHNLIEEVLRENQNELANKKIKIIRKKFDPELPETTLTDEQLRFIFNSVFQYIFFSISQNGRIGILTRSIDSQEWTGEQKSHLQKNLKYIEVLIVSTQLDLKGQSVETLSPLPNEDQEKKMDLILQMVKKTLEKNRGAMDTQWEVQKGMTLISLVLPIERRNVFHVLLPQDRLKKTERKD